MFNSPKSMTAIVHLKFHYKETEIGPVGEGEVELLSRILDKASALSPEYQELLHKFADFLNSASSEKGEQNP